MKDTGLDPHLGKALAHAPDREATPPPHVSAQILAAAHREATAAAPAVRPTAPPWWRRPWLASRASGASGALATVLIAAFVGLLWRGEPPGPAVDGPAPAVLVEAAAPAAIPPPEGPPVPAKPAVPATPPAPAYLATKPPVTAGAAAQAERARADLEAQSRQAKALADATEGSAAERRFALPARARAQVAAESKVAAAPEMPRPAAPPPVPAPAAPVPASPAPAAVPATASPAPPAAATPAGTAGALRAESSPSAPVAPLAARPAQAGLPAWQPGDQLTWDPASANPAPSGPWLQRLAALTQPAWVRSGEAPLAATRLGWLREGAALGALQWDTGVVWWCAAGQSCLRAEVPPDALRDLVGLLGKEASER